MFRCFTLSGIGLGLYLLGLGVAYFIDISVGGHLLSQWFQFYPLLPVLLGLDYILYTVKPDLPIQKPEGLVTTVIIIITIAGFVFSITPKLVRNELGQWRDYRDHDFHFGPVTKVTLKNDFTIPPGVSKVIVENTTGEVNADSVDGQTISAEAVIKMRIPPSEAGNFQKEFKISGETTGDTLIIKLEKPGNYPRLRLKRISVDFTVDLPKGLNLKIINATGNVKVGAVEGNLDVELNTGEISVHNVSRNVNLSNHTGAIRVGTIMGDANISLRTGEIHSEKIYGKAVIENFTGGIDLEECRGAVDVSLRTGNLTVNLTNIHADCSLENRMGNIELGVPAKADCTIEAYSRMGNIDSDFPLAIKKELAATGASGKINDGGPLIKAETRTGNIEINQL